MKTELYKISKQPHEEMRYDTVGDWQPSTQEGKPDEIIVAEMGNPDYHFLIALHEWIEFYLCQKKGIGDKEVTEFDEMFEKEREEGKHTDDEEAGDDPRAPYRLEHEFAGIFERMVAHKLGVDWKIYDGIVMNL